MKRFSSDVYNLEPRMRKKAAQDLGKELELLKEAKTTPRRKVKYDSFGEPFYTLDTLPSSMFHLGGDKFISIVFFLGQTRVHVRRYTTDQEEFLHPTKDGVSLSPFIWHQFQEKSYNFIDDFLVIDKDLCISHEKKEGENLYVFQRMFQKRNMSFQFIPERVLLTENQMDNLKGLFPNINRKVKEHLIQQTMANLVLHEHGQSASVLNRSDSSVYVDLHDTANLTHSLSVCLTNSLSSKISELFKCFACESGYVKPDLHECVLQTHSEKYEGYFELAFYKLDWHQIAKDFYKENVNDFSKIFVHDFFSSLDINSLLNDIKNLYIDAEEKVINCDK